MPQEKSTRQRVLEEIVATEQGYMRDLQAVAEVFIGPLRKNAILNPQEVQELFSSWEVLVPFSQKLFTDLDVAMKRATGDGKACVGPVFVEFAPHFRLYSDYLKNYERGMAAKTSFMGKYPAFGEFLTAMASDPRCHGLDLGSFLIMPVQRVPRYKLLIDELFKHTPQNHPDHDHLVVALEKIQEAALHNNKMIGKSAEFDTLMAIQLKFEANTVLNLLDVPSRRFVREGDLDKLCRNGVKSRHFWLFNDKLIYAVYLLNGYQLHQDIDLRECEIAPAETVQDQDRAFEIISTKKSFVVWARESSEADEWREAITKCIEDVRARTGDMPRTRADVAPIWTPDAAVPACMSCGATFSVMRRKHHCRNCGRAVCGACSKNKLRLKHIDESKDLRVCTPCFGTLTGQTDSLRDSTEGKMMSKHMTVHASRRPGTGFASMGKKSNESLEQQLGGKLDPKKSQFIQKLERTPDEIGKLIRNASRSPLILDQALQQRLMDVSATSTRPRSRQPAYRPCKPTLLRTPSTPATGKSSTVGSSSAFLGGSKISPGSSGKGSRISEASHNNTPGFRKSLPKNAKTPPPPPPRANKPSRTSTAPSSSSSSSSSASNGNSSAPSAPSRTAPKKAPPPVPSAPKKTPPAAPPRPGGKTPPAPPARSTTGKTPPPPPVRSATGKTPPPPPARPGGANPPRTASSSSGSSAGGGGGGYSLDNIRELRKTGVPSGWDSARLEAYLTEAEFQAAFKMSRADFDALPAWKRRDKKKAAGLF